MLKIHSARKPFIFLHSSLKNKPIYTKIPDNTTTEMLSLNIWKSSGRVEPYPLIQFFNYFFLSSYGVRLCLFIDDLWMKMPAEITTFMIYYAIA